MLSGIFHAKYKGIYQFTVSVAHCSYGEIDFELVRSRPGSRHSELILAVGKGTQNGKGSMSSYSQATVTVFAELCPNDQVRI